MKAKSRILFTAFLSAISSVLIAQPVNINTAKAIAEHHLSTIQKQSLKSASSKGNNFHFTSVKVAVENKDTLFYILNDTINKGFVIVSADKRVWPILGYSTEGSFNEKQQPEAFTTWMDNKKKEIEFTKKNNLKPDSATVASWQNLSLKSASTTSTSVDPLLETKWDQGCFYNELCPSDVKSSYCGHTPTGCVATAMAQIMKYWNYPTKGKGSNSYTNAKYGIISADFGSTTYQWDQMPDSLIGSNNAVATLMYHCGVAANMQYDTYASSTFFYPESFVDFFDYSSTAELKQRGSYSTDEWIDMFKTELDLGHPILYENGNMYGEHAYVCDGYLGNQDAVYFHFNWGWGGINDGNYLINDPNLGDSSISGYERALIHIMPAHLPEGFKGILLSAKKVNLLGNTGQVNVLSSVDWNVSSDHAWLNLSMTKSSAGNSTLGFTAMENSTDSDRTALVTIKAEGVLPIVIQVIQSRTYISQITAGGLQKALGKNMGSITKLVVKGTIDARDFKTMRDLMPLLTEIDLSGATIVSYTGADGTNLNPGSSGYPANTVPNHAFDSLSPVNNSYIGKQSLISIVLPSNVTEIQQESFGFCINLANINLPSSLTVIGPAAFLNCASLKSINIPSSVFLIDQVAFCSCKQLTSITVDKDNLNYSSAQGVLFNKQQTELITYPAGKSGGYIIPSTVVSIVTRSFEECNKLISIVIPSSVKTIGELTFSGCSKLNSLNIPGSVTSFDFSAFAACVGLNSITLNWPIPYYLDNPEWGSPCSTGFKNYCTLYVPYGTASLYRISNHWKDFFKIVENNGFSVGAITAKLDSPAGSEASVLLKANVGWTASSDQSWLSVSPSSGNGNATLTFTTNSKNNIGPGRLATVRISGTGYDSQNITVTQDGGVLNLAKAGTLSTILTSSQLNSLICLKLSGNIDARDFKTMRDLMPSLAEIDLSTASIVAYTGTQGTSFDPGIISYAANNVPEKAFLTSITNGLWIGKTTLTSLVLPSNATAICIDAFYGCIRLEKISLPSSLISIDIRAFSNCFVLSTIAIPALVTYIAPGIFGNCSLLTTITVDDANDYYSASDGVLFNKQKTNLIQCLSGKTSSYTIPSTVTSIDLFSFYSCINLTSIEIPPSVVKIVRGAFLGCWKLSSINLPSSIKTIEGDAFAACNQLTSIEVGWQEPLPLNDKSIFDGTNKSTCTLYVPYGSKAAYQAASIWKDFTNIVEMPGFNLSATTANVEAAQGSFATIGISSDVTYTVNSDQTWLTVTPLVGTGTNLLTFTAEENPNKTVRSSTVTVSSAGVESQTITVTQNAKNTTRIDPMSIKPDLILYPNPTTGKLLLVFDQIPLNGISVSIEDITGKNCLKQLIREKEVWIDLSGNNPGIYFLKTDQENIKVQKVILK